MLESDQPGSAAATANQNPIAIVFDTDALLQLLIADQMALLHAFKKRVQIQPGIVEAVEVEIRKSRKFQGRFTKELQKAIDSKTLLVLDVPALSSFAPVDARATYETIQSRGFELNAVLDYGEAYTYAAGVVLKSPVVSNDIRAVRAGKNAGLDLPEHILRLFDFIVLCHHIDEINSDRCDEVRKTLADKKEWIPLAFQHSSFQDGLGSFYPRLLQRSRTPVGAVTPKSELDVRLDITVSRPK